MSLRDLDARLLPRCASSLRAALDRVVSGRAAVAGALPRHRTALVLAAAVLVTGAGAALALGGSPAGGTSGSAGTAPPVLGPLPGAGVDEHLRAGERRLAALTAERPGAVHLALVSLRQGLTPEAAGELLAGSGVVLERGYLLAEAPGRPEQLPFQTPGDVVAGLRQVFAATAVRKADEAQDLLGAAARLAGGGPQEQAARERLEQQAATVAAEAVAYGSGCACVFALLVSGPAADLAALSSRPGVRGVEPAAAGARLEPLEVRPLQPSVVGVVPEQAGP